MNKKRESDGLGMNSLMNKLSEKSICIRGPVFEAVICLIFLAIQALIICMDAISLEWLIRINSIFLLWLFLAAWKRFAGGMHICFLFIGMILLFQSGRLLAFTFNPLFGNTPDLLDPFRFVLMREVPFDISRETAEMTMLAIVSSAVFIYLPCSIRFKSIRLSNTLTSSFMRGLYRIYFLTFPFLLYKNIRYFLFIRDHGGYLALYLIRDQILSSVDIVTRLLSLAASLTFIIIFLFEYDKKRIQLITFTYFVVSILDLLIGMRGKVFTLLLSLWFIQNLKTGKRFHLYRITIIGALLAYTAMFAANFRENQDLKLLSPLSFISAQGISMQVTEAVVGYRRDFIHNPFMYLIHEIEAPFFPTSQVSEPSGESLAGDLTPYLSSRAAAEGYGTGSSYIAEAYLFGGLCGVIIISFAIGCFLAWMHSFCKSTIGALFLAYTMPTLIYLPRSGLLDPLAISLKTFIALISLIPIFFIIKKVPKISIAGSNRNQILKTQ